MDGWERDGLLLRNEVSDRDKQEIRRALQLDRQQGYDTQYWTDLREQSLQGHLANKLSMHQDLRTSVALVEPEKSEKQVYQAAGEYCDPCIMSAGNDGQEPIHVRSTLVIDTTLPMASEKGLSPNRNLVFVAGTVSCVRPLSDV